MTCAPWCPDTPSSPKAGDFAPSWLPLSSTARAGWRSWLPPNQFRQHQVRHLTRARTLGTPVSDPERAHRNRLARDRIIAEDAAQSARRAGIRVIEIDGTQNVDTITDVLADHFSPYLPAHAKA